MRRFLAVLFGMLLSTGAGSIGFAEGTVLRVVSVDGAEQKLDAHAWAALPRTTVKAIDHDSKEGAFEGVAVRDVLKLANAPLGKDLRGKNLALYVVAEAVDGYRVVYALTEFDGDFSDRTILIADRRDGHALAEKEGPLRFVVPGDKRPARWIRELVSVSVKRAP